MLRSVLAGALAWGFAPALQAQPAATATVTVTPASGATQTAPPPQPPPAQIATPPTPRGAVGPANAPAEVTAFDIEVRAPAPLRPLLEKHMELRRYRAVTDLDDAELARLTSQAGLDVRNLVGTLGYFSPTVDITREVSAGGRARIVVSVTPGPVTRVESVNLAFTGDIAGSADADAQRQQAEIRRDWRLPSGQPFTQDAWDAAKSQALRQLVARRYPAGRITYSLADVEAPANRVRLGLQLDSGPLFRLGPMSISGIERYDPRLVPRLARLPEGTVYDQQQLVEAQQRLSASGYFDSVYFFVDPQSEPAAAPVQVQVREAPLQKVVFGVGAATDTGPRVSVGHTHHRVPGIGWRAVTELQINRQSPSLQSEWTAIPDEDGWRWGVLGRADRVDDGALITYAQKLRIGRSEAGERIDRNIYVQYDTARVQQEGGPALTGASTGDGSALSANYVWTGRYFDRLPFPSRGYGLGFEAGGGITLGAQRKPYLRGVVRWLGIHPLGAGRLALRAEAGGVAAATDAPVPSPQLFRTGGDTTVRGYGYRDIGVTLPGGVIGPGRYMSSGSVEWQRPIVRNGIRTDWENTLFLDAGAVADRVQDLHAVFGVGVGARWRSPIGPLQMDLAYGVQPRRWRLHVNVGFTF
ncbi:MAG: BamA/TamA family outer membrane protein [Ramlibacter sp.]|nr:BamA/TamA family outer membrane protein [Ramlibacter sp.]